MTPTQAQETVAKAIRASFRAWYDLPQNVNDRPTLANLAAEAAVAALLDQYGQTQWGVLRPDGHQIPQRGSGPDAEPFMRDYVSKFGGVVVSRRVLPSIETEWEPAT